MKRWLVLVLGVCLGVIASFNPRAAAQPEDMVTAPPAVERNGSPGLAPEPHASEEPMASPEAQALLGEWLRYRAELGRRGRLSGGFNTLFAGALLMGAGIPLFIQSSPGTELNKGIGLGAIGLSAVFLSTGIFQLAKKGGAETRYRRWQDAAGSTLTLRELGRFEGEFRGEADQAARSVRMARWVSFGGGMVGALVLGLTPAANLSTDAARLSYAVGGVALGAGLLGFGFSFIGRSKVSDYEAYLQGQSPLSTQRWRAFPAIGRNQFGAQVVGRF